ncbi:LCP family protein [Leucobacter sp. W1478]|uniref:LCP family protein n=1 Tax=Leucobacter sp. W1478 TaxID=3439065 RepID=UPI003F2C6B2E
MGQTKRQGEGSPTSVRHGELRRSNSWANAAKVLLTALIVVALSGVSVAAYAVWGLVDGLKTVDLVAPAEDPEAVGAGVQSLEGALTVLLVGSDSRAGQSLDDGEEGELNDVNLLLHVSADHQNATVISFPRDLMVPIPSCPGPNGEPNYYSAMSEQQLNSALSYGGLPCVAQTIEKLTGMPVPYAGLVTFDGVIAVSNAIGGVEVCLNEPINDDYTGLYLPAGDVSLQGYDALAYLRTRHGVGNGSDVSRISNQQIFMSSLVREMRSADTLTNPVKVYGLAKAGVENMTLSSNMATVQFMQALAGTVADIDLERINFVQYPSFSHPYEAGRLTPDYPSATTLIDILLAGQPFEVGSMGEGVATVDPVETAPADGTEVPGEATDPAAPTDGTTAPADGTAVETGPVVLPQNITGQSAATQTCSQGRTQY